MGKRYALLLIAVAAFLAVVAAGFGIYGWTSGSPQTISGQSAPHAPVTSYVILKPATVPPKISECQQSLSYASDGNPAPVQCNDGSLNTLAWNAISALEPTVMKLGYTPTQAEVESAMCNDANAANADSSAAISAPLEETAYALSSLYYGWSFGLNPSSVLAGC